VDLLTCHCDQPEHIQRTWTWASTRLLGVTVLTSLASEDLAGMGYPDEADRSPRPGKKRAGLAMAAGCSGVVCSGQEAGAMREQLGPDALIVCPGIRLASPGAGMTKSGS
jgi:orotidine-5'-phosphate decarboxylase